jgi:hypothetical protein
VKSMGADGRGKNGLQGQYANHVRIGVGDLEVVLDFGQYFLEEGEPLFHTRIILTPQDAQALLETLMGALAQSEKMTGGHGQEQ